jgi:hypothetical protein
MEDPHGLALQLTYLGVVAAAQGDLARAKALGEEALAIWRNRGDAWGTASTLIQLGKVARAEGAPVRASELFRDSLAQNVPLGDKEITARAVFELAVLACERGEFSRGARLYGGIAALRDAIGAPLAPVDRLRYEEAVTATHAALSEEQFRIAWDAGYSLPPERVLSEALRPDEASTAPDNA